MDIKLFGFQITRPKPEPKAAQSFVTPVAEDGPPLFQLVVIMGRMLILMRRVKQNQS
jgi:hypothetical protein